MSDDYGITPEQYHAGLDKLWNALRGGSSGDDVFTLCSNRIKELEGQLEEFKSLSLEILSQCCSSALGCDLSSELVVSVDSIDEHLNRLEELTRDK